MSTYGENLRAKTADRDRSSRAATRALDVCVNGGRHHWNAEAAHDEANLQIAEPERKLRIRLGTCLRCSDVVLSITAQDDENWKLHQQLVSVSDPRATIR
ncbi:hypothetical protein [Tenggerimyces flavus]|uniref:Uncharacterized protein n=1 Tax=Tenggerimyces flavus TaxID=1708749 RepID=A0ABV7YME1_9ACTN|nr:hypothetical protein [Tenggerimyces flavus]MBM7787604.1 hypothetical protein [Tenggerimyces flavus]